jgi:hypothetical protein
MSSIFGIPFLLSFQQILLATEKPRKIIIKILIKFNLFLREPVVCKYAYIYKLLGIKYGLSPLSTCPCYAKLKPKTRTILLFAGPKREGSKAGKPQPSHFSQVRIHYYKILFLGRS